MKQPFFTAAKPGLYLEGVILEELNLGKMIQSIRGEKGLSIRKVATLAGITPSMLSQIENKQANPSINTLRAIAQVLEVPLYTFFQERPMESLVVHPEIGRAHV